jgi:asparagine synthetase B (glutamine-hydrolysing)
MADGHGFELLLMHNLLDICGHAARRPVVSGDNQAGTQQVLLFNGEIYNYDRTSTCPRATTRARCAWRSIC